MMAATAMSGLSGKKMTRFMEDTVKPKGDDIDRSKMAEDVLSRVSGRQLTRFLEDELKPKGDDIDREGVEGRECYILIQFQGGSLGKGTAVKGSSDIDLEVVFNGLSNIEELKNNREVLLDRIERAAEKYKWRGGIQQTKRTQFSIQFKLNGKDVDVLPAFDAMKRLEAETLNACYF
nr:hypothetical protein BaRGS_014061 [Batillaria attramentaria]